MSPKMRGCFQAQSEIIFFLECLIQERGTMRFWKPAHLIK